MRILHVVPTYLPATRYGGPIVAVHSLCRALAARGHAVEVFTTSIDGPLDTAGPHDRAGLLGGGEGPCFFSPRPARYGGAVRSAGHAGRREGPLFCLPPAAPLVVRAVVDAIVARRNIGGR